MRSVPGQLFLMSNRPSHPPVQPSAPVFRGRRSVAFWLLLVLYPLFNALGTFPVVVGADAMSGMSVEFVFSVICVGVVALQAIGGLRIDWGPQAFWLGLVVWLSANVLSLVLNRVVGAEMLVARLGMKALFGYMVYWVLVDNGELDVLLKSYIVGCIFAGLCSLAFWYQVGDLEQIRHANFVGSDSPEMEVDVFRGVARLGTGNLLPLWICLILYPTERSALVRMALLACIPFFAVLSMLALRREVLVEGAAGLVLLLVLMPRRYRGVAGLSALLFAGVVGALVVSSERWRDRLINETQEQFQSGTDPRTVLLLNTPSELRQSPLWGHGPGMYHRRMGAYFSGNAEVEKEGIAAHNSFSRAAVETGLLGLGGFTLLVGALGWWCVFDRKRGPEFGPLRLWSAMIFLHVFDWLFFGDGMAANMTWYFCGVLLFLNHRRTAMARGAPGARANRGARQWESRRLGA